jgi:peptidoglycan/LPS O-acetylase OafA/YrhL
MNSRIKNVDALRGLAILGVISIHSIYNADAVVKSNGGETNAILTSMLNQGKYGVELFFFISGWLLSSLYKTSNKGARRTYWIRRLARIYPLWGVFIIIGTLRIYSSDGFKLEIREFQEFSLVELLFTIFLHLTFLTFLSAAAWNTLVPGGWSIQSEVLHYLMFWKITRTNKNLLLNIYILVGLCSFSIQFIKEESVNIFLYNLIQSWLRLNLFSTIVYFILGMVYSNLMQGKNIPEFKSYFNLKCCIAIIIFLNLPLNFGHNLIAIIFIAVSVFVVTYSPKIISSALSRIGKYSYFVYFFHFIVIDLLYEFYSTQTRISHQILMFFIFFSLATSISTFVGIFSYRFVEKPIMIYAKNRTKD